MLMDLYYDCVFSPGIFNYTAAGMEQVENTIWPRLGISSWTWRENIWASSWTIKGNAAKHPTMFRAATHIQNGKSTKIKKPYPTALLLKVRSMDQWHLHHLKCYLKCRISGLTLDLQNQNLYFNKISGWAECTLKFEKPLLIHLLSSHSYITSSLPSLSPMPFFAIALRTKRHSEEI